MKPLVYAYRPGKRRPDPWMKPVLIGVLIITAYMGWQVSHYFTADVEQEQSE